MSRARGCLAGLAISLIAAAPASAATVVDLGPGDTPSVAVDPRRDGAHRVQLARR